MCDRPRRWYRGEWRPYCGGTQCTNPVRICKNLDCPRPDRKFTASEGFSKYCSVECRNVTNGLVRQRGPATCPIHGTSHAGRNRWQLCGECMAVIFGVRAALRNHHVPTSMVVDLIKNPVCHNRECGVNLFVALPRAGDRPRIPFVVDHDHNCPTCKGAPVSCGLCVRGFLCFRCNAMLGQALDDASLLRGGADYLDAWQSRGEAAD